jgi:Protein of unknown function (DUF2971)
MLPNRRFVPSEADILYHYCSPQTFLTICTTKCLRFSDLFAMNDFMEVHWGYHVWERAASAVLDLVGKPFLDDIDEIIHKSGLKALALATCLSRNGDVLSQWRAYGADGTGYAIGFKASDITQLPVQPLRVEYNLDIQVEEVKNFILALHDVEKTEITPRGQDFFNACASLAFDLNSFKNPAFSEEDEVRLLHLVNFQKSNSTLRLVDPGGTSFGQPAVPQAISFHMSSSTPVAHVDLTFTGKGNKWPIVEVVLGPKNDSLLSGVSVFLETLNLPNVRVRKSAASYR